MNPTHTTASTADYALSRGYGPPSQEYGQKEVFKLHAHLAKNTSLKPTSVVENHGLQERYWKEKWTLKTPN